MAGIKGNISFALIDIPIVMSNVIKDNDLSFHQIHKKCGERISYIKYCQKCKKKVSNNEIIKGYLYEENEYVLLEKDELEKLKPENDHEIEILSFVNSKEIEDFYFEKNYVLSASGKGKSYALFYEALKKTGLIHYQGV